MFRRHMTDANYSCYWALISQPFRHVVIYSTFESAKIQFKFCTEWQQIDSFSESICSIVHTDTSQCSRFFSMFLRRFLSFRNNRNNIPLLRFLPAQTDMVVCHSCRNFNKIIALCSGMFLYSHLFTCFCTGSTDFRSNCCVQVTSAFKSFRFLSSFKMAASTARLLKVD